MNPHSSLAVFYVEQVALNRHVLFQSDRENRVRVKRVNNFVRKFLRFDFAGLNSSITPLCLAVNFGSQAVRCLLMYETGTR